MSRDITALKQTEAALRASEENYRQLFEQAGDGIFIADGQGNYVDVNLSGCDLLGYTRDEILKLICATWFRLMTRTGAPADGAEKRAARGWRTAHAL